MIRQRTSNEIIFNEAQVNVGDGNGRTRINKIPIIADMTYTFKPSQLTYQKIEHLLNNYICFLQKCPTRSLQTQQLNQQTSGNGILFGGMIRHSIDYFKMLKAILERRLASALSSKIPTEIEGEKNFLLNLKNTLLIKIGQNAISRPELVDTGNPQKVLEMLGSGITLANDNLANSNAARMNM